LEKMKRPLSAPTKGKWTREGEAGVKKRLLGKKSPNKVCGAVFSSRNSWKQLGSANRVRVRGGKRMRENTEVRKKTKKVMTERNIYHGARRLVVQKAQLALHTNRKSHMVEKPQNVT